MVFAEHVRPTPLTDERLRRVADAVGFREPIFLENGAEVDP
jgi:hypothetical protein